MLRFGLLDVSGEDQGGMGFGEFTEIANVSVPNGQKLMMQYRIQ